MQGQRSKDPILKEYLQTVFGMCKNIYKNGRKAANLSFFYSITDMKLII